ATGTEGTRECATGTTMTRTSSSRSKTGSAAALVVLLTVGLGLTWVPSAHAVGCQAGGAISLFPNTGTTCATKLHVGDFVNVLIRVVNTCTTLACNGGSNAGTNCTDDSECPGGVCGTNVAAKLRDVC